VARSTWSGAISFGMVSIPVKLYTAVGREGEEKIDLHLVHAKDGERIHYERTCEKGHRKLGWDEIAKG
jgi:DNA end-binding protein Ku